MISCSGEPRGRIIDHRLRLVFRLTRLHFRHFGRMTLSLLIQLQYFRNDRLIKLTTTDERSPRRTEMRVRIGKESFCDGTLLFGEYQCIE